MHDDGENDENASANGDYDDLLILEALISLVLSRVERLFIDIIWLITKYFRKDGLIHSKYITYAIL